MSLTQVAGADIDLRPGQARACPHVISSEPCNNPHHLMDEETSHARPPVTSPLTVCSPFTDGEVEGMGGKENTTEQVAELGPEPRLQTPRGML